MIKLLVTLGVMNLLGAMSPGPDFAVVTRNALRHSRKGGVLTALGISVAALIHIGYCSLGLTTLIAQSLMVFTVIKCVGGLYLIYLGCAGLLSSSSAAMNKTAGFDPKAQPSLVKRQVFWQGFLTNALNPKAALFFLALFTAVVGNHRLGWLTIIVAMELFCVIFLWFSFLSWLITHPRLYGRFMRYQHTIVQVLSVFLIGFGVMLFFIHPLSTQT